MCRGMRKPYRLKVRRYTDHLIDLNKYSDSFPGEKLTDKISMTELNEIVLNSMTNSWTKQEYVKGFYYKSITQKNDVNMFEHM